MLYLAIAQGLCDFAFHHLLSGKEARLGGPAIFLVFGGSCGAMAAVILLLA